MPHDLENEKKRRKIKFHGYLTYRLSYVFTCSKSTTETPEQCVKFVQSYQ